MPKLQEPSRVAYEASLQKEKTREVRKDIQKIESVDKTDEKALEELHRYLDGKYQGCISEWGKSMWCYSKDTGFDYYLMGADSLTDNLNQMKPKLEAYALGWNESKRGSPSRSATAPNVNVTVNNEININITFEQAREKVQEMTSLTDEQTQEVLDKITEIETAYKEGSKKSKWEKVKPILVWLADKSFDVGMTLLPLLLKLEG